MPLYSYYCGSCNSRFDEFAKMDQSADPAICACGSLAPRVITATRISQDYEGYQCPVTDRWISGKAAHRENLKQTGCRVLEPGERETNERLRQRQEAEFDSKIEATVEKEIEALPSDKRERLANELLSGVDVSVERR
jgi:putative FmdB family regulatory protein